MQQLLPWKRNDPNHNKTCYKNNLIIQRTKIQPLKLQKPIW